jgi:hypothetical protein
MQCLPATPTGQHSLVPNKPTEPANDATANSGEEEPTAPNKPTEPTVASEPEPEPITMIEELTEPTEPIEPTEPEPITVMEPAVDDAASINGGEDQPEAPAPVPAVVPTNSNQPPADHQKLQADLACGCQRTQPAAVAAAQALAAAGGDCSSPIGQALAQAYAQAVAAGTGQVVAQAFAVADASAAQKVFFRNIIYFVWGNEALCSCHPLQLADEPASACWSDCTVARGAICSRTSHACPAADSWRRHRIMASQFELQVRQRTLTGFWLWCLQCLNPANRASLSTCVAAFVGDCCTNQGLATGASCGGMRKVISTSPRVIETAGIASTRCSC